MSDIQKVIEYFGYKGRIIRARDGKYDVIGKENEGDLKTKVLGSYTEEQLMTHYQNASMMDPVSQEEKDQKGSVSEYLSNRGVEAPK